MMVAAKELYESVIFNNEDALYDMKHEVKMIMTLLHPNIIRCYGLADSYPGHTQLSVFERCLSGLVDLVTQREIEEKA